MPLIKRADAARDCGVCVKSISKYAKSVTCPACNYETCPKCIKIYLGSVQGGILKCMNCNKGFTQEFVIQNLGQSFIKKEYRKIREEALFEAQLLLIPSSMAYVEMVQQQKSLEQDMEALMDQRSALMAQLAAMNMQINDRRQAIDDMKARIINDKDVGGAGSRGGRKCLVADCNGAMCIVRDDTSRIECAACTGVACAKCLEIVAINGQEDAAHVCDESVLLNMKEIAENSKPCPGCSMSIHKTEGCSQMFCTSCHTAFDYNTGKVVGAANIHNPHFYEWLQENPAAANAFQEGRLDDFIRVGGDGAAQDANTAVPCGRRVPTAVEVRRALSWWPEVQRIAMNIHRVAIHFMDEARWLNEKLLNAVDADAFYRDLRIKYIMKELDDVDFKRDLYMRERSNDKMIAMHNLYDMFSSVAIDYIARMSIDGGDNNEHAHMGLLKELGKLRNYFNKESAEISKRFTARMLLVGPHWELV